MTVLLILSLGAAVITLGTYLALTTGHTSVRVYDLVNVCAAPPIAAYAVACGAWPSVLLTASYFVAASVGLSTKRKKRVAV